MKTLSKQKAATMAKKERVNVRLDPELLERLRNAVWHIGKGLTLTGVLEDGARHSLEELEKKNGGKPYPPRTSELPKSPKKK